MSRVVGAIVCVLMVACSDQVDLSTDQVEASNSWLEMVDAGDYSGSWEQASKVFKAGVRQADWVLQVRSVRGPMGALSQRTLRSTVALTNPPGAPDGEYLRTTYDSAFANKAAAIETHTLFHGADGGWRTAGYFIR